MQGVREATNPLLYRLLKAFEALTGVPVLINTSFNVKGEPIVETPEDALMCFLTTGIDHLVLHDMLVSKGVMHKFVNRAAGLRGMLASGNPEGRLSLKQAFLKRPWALALSATACPAASTRRCNRPQPS